MKSIYLGAQTELEAHIWTQTPWDTILTWVTTIFCDFLFFGTPYSPKTWKSYLTWPIKSQIWWKSMNLEYLKTILMHFWMWLSISPSSWGLKWVSKIAFEALTAFSKPFMHLNMLRNHWNISTKSIYIFRKNQSKRWAILL